MGGCIEDAYPPVGCDYYYSWQEISWDYDPPGYLTSPSDALSDLGDVFRLEVQWEYPYVAEYPLLTQLKDWSFELDRHERRRPVFASAGEYDLECPDLLIIPLSVIARSLDNRVYIETTGRNISTRWTSELEPPWYAPVSQWRVTRHGQSLSLTISPERQDVVHLSDDLHVMLANEAEERSSTFVRMHVGGGGFDEHGIVTLYWEGVPIHNPNGTLFSLFGVGHDWNMSRR